MLSWPGEVPAIFFGREEDARDQHEHDEKGGAGELG
jgi:hypothetical protein